jgi:hypothetical protein
MRQAQQRGHPAVAVQHHAIRCERQRALADLLDQPAIRPVSSVSQSRRMLAMARAGRAVVPLT